MRTPLKAARRPPSPPELQQLLTLRLERDWSWAYLEAQMIMVGCRVSRYTLLDMRARVGKLQRGHHDRTLYKIRKFLKLQRSHHRRQTDPGRPWTATA
jgi:hypothetical protein